MLGPVQSEMQYDIVRGFFEDCTHNGYKFAMGGDGELREVNRIRYSASNLDNAPDNSCIVTGEPFGSQILLAQPHNHT